MSDFFDLTLSRQSCRSYTGESVEHEKLVKIAEAAMRAPSGCNSQPWKFIFVESEEQKKVVAEACQSFPGVNRYTEQVGAFAVVLEEYAVLMPSLRSVIDSQYFAKIDIGGAVVTICYAAQELGVASCIMGMFDRDKIEKALGIGRESRVAIVIALGYPTKPDVRRKPRKEFDDVVSFA